MYMAITLKFISQLTNHLFCLMWYTDIVYLLCSSSGPREADGIVMPILQTRKLMHREYDNVPTIVLIATETVPLCESESMP